jgi:hypothetical protein
MPLQIRRGTNAERLAMTQPLAPGELLFVTTPGSERLYVGNGSTLGGVQITGYTDADAKDAAAAMITSGTHSSISFSYNTITDVLSATVDLSNYTGTINASSLKGSIFADDSSLMVDTIDGKIYAANGFFGNLTGNVTGNVTGNLAGNVTGNLVGFHTGDMKGSVFGDDSVALVNGPDSSINLDGTVKSNIIPSTTNTYDIGGTSNVFANLYTTSILNSSGSSVLNTSSKTASLAQINLESSGLFTGTSMIATIPSILYATTSVSPTDPWPNLLTANSTGAPTNSLGLSRSRGTFVAPTTVNNGDEIGSISINGHDGTNFVASAEIICSVNGAVSTAVVPSKIDLNVTNSTGTLATRVSVKATGVDFSVPPKLPVVANDTARTALVATPSTGMLIFMQAGTTPAATNVVQVYNGAAWVNLH